MHDSLRVTHNQIIAAVEKLLVIIYLFQQKNLAASLFGILSPFWMTIHTSHDCNRMTRHKMTLLLSNFY